MGWHVLYMFLLNNGSGLENISDSKMEIEFTSKRDVKDGKLYGYFDGCQKQKIRDIPCVSISVKYGDCDDYLTFFNYIKKNTKATEIFAFSEEPEEGNRAILPIYYKRGERTKAEKKILDNATENLSKKIEKSLIDDAFLLKYDAVISGSFAVSCFVDTAFNDVNIYVPENNYEKCIKKFEKKCKKISTDTFSIKKIEYETTSFESTIGTIFKICKVSGAKTKKDVRKFINRNFDFDVSTVNWDGKKWEWCPFLQLEDLVEMKLKRLNIRNEADGMDEDDDYDTFDFDKEEAETKVLEEEYEKKALKYKERGFVDVTNKFSIKKKTAFVKKVVDYYIQENQKEIE